MSFALIAHRGFSSRAPENTLYAFDLALEHGFDNFELDAQLTSDGALIVYHDFELSRTTEATGEVSAHTLADIRALDTSTSFRAGGGSEEFAGAMIPTLDEVLGRYAGRAHPHLELKSREADLPAMVADALKRHGWLDVAGGGPFESPGITVTSFWADQLYRSVLRLPNVRHGWLVHEVTTETIDIALKLGFNGVYPRAATATADTIGRAHDKGLTVRGWGVDSTDDLTRLVNAGALGTTVNWPDVAQEHIASLG